MKPFEYENEDGAFNVFPAEINTMIAITNNQNGVQMITTWFELAEIHLGIGELLDKHFNTDDVEETSQARE